MYRILFTGLILLAAATGLSAQREVRFALDASGLVEAGILEDLDGIRFYVRGDFNRWSGRDLQLEREPGTTLFTGRFHIEGEEGDTLYYKFVMDRRGEIIWEHRPAPPPAENGNRMLVLAGGMQDTGEASFSPDPYFGHPVVFARDLLQEDYLRFRAILEETHPALYDYTPKEVLDSLFDAGYARIDTALAFEDFLMIMTEVISRVGCGHTSLWIPGRYWSEAPEGLFPLRLRVKGEKALVDASCGSLSPLIPGSRIHAVNGTPVEDLLKRLESLTSADGLIQANREARVGRGFAVKYAMAFGFHERFLVQYSLPGKKDLHETWLSAVGKKEVDALKEGRPVLSYREVEKGIGLLTINSFGYYGEVPVFRTFMDSVFLDIREKGTDRLIMDLRGNGGGDPFCASYLWAFLQPGPRPYFEDHYGKYDTLALPVPMGPYPYKGKLYTLIDGHCFSTTGHFTGLLSYHGVGEFVGSESGATYTCTGNATYPALYHTGIMVGTARVMRYTAAVRDMDPRRGILPHHPVEITGEDLSAGRDPVMEKALELCRDW